MGVPSPSKTNRPARGALSCRTDNANAMRQGITLGRAVCFCSLHKEPVVGAALVVFMSMPTPVPLMAAGRTGSVT